MFAPATVRWYVVFLVIVVLLPAVAFAAGMPQKIVPCNGIDCKVCDIASLAQNVLNMGIFLAVFLAAVLFAWAGIKFLTNQTNPGGLGAARQMFFNALLGLVLILAAWLLVDTIMYIFMGSHLWNKLC